MNKNKKSILIFSFFIVFIISVSFVLFLPKIQELKIKFKL